ncbi:hypothetical protein SISNIDRAFT_384717, partial [Sistotremastrum niveocremeum HHB9708]
RLRSDNYNWDELRFPPEEMQYLDIHKDSLHVHQTLQINYTSYDLQRGRDSIKPYLEFKPSKIVSNNAPRCHIMLSAREGEAADGTQTAHSFWYAQVLAIFHVMARDRLGSSSEHRRIDLVWVRWLGLEQESQGSFKAKRLQKVGFPYALLADPDALAAFGFVDPADILRGAHLIPSFAQGRRHDLFGMEVRSAVQPPDGDYQYFSVNQFVDRDMAMRYRGGGVGH